MTNPLALEVRSKELARVSLEKDWELAAQLARLAEGRDWLPSLQQVSLHARLILGVLYPGSATG